MRVYQLWTTCPEDGHVSTWHRNRQDAYTALRKWYRKRNRAGLGLLGTGAKVFLHQVPETKDALIRFLNDRASLGPMPDHPSFNL